MFRGSHYEDHDILGSLYWGPPVWGLHDRVIGRGLDSRCRAWGLGV